MTHVLHAAGLSPLWIFVAGMAAMLFLHAVVDIAVQPELDGGRKLLWGAFVLVIPFAGPLLWYKRGPRTLLER